jgi:hypothetical protein
MSDMYQTSRLLGDYRSRPPAANSPLIIMIGKAPAVDAQCRRRFFD